MSGTNINWPPKGNGSGGGGPATVIAFSIGSMDAQAASVNGASVSSSSIFMQSASSTSPGLVNTVAQAFLGQKTFVNAPVFSSLPLGNVVTVGSTGVASTIPYTASPTAGVLVSRDFNGATTALNFVSQTTTVQSSGTSNLVLSAASTRFQKIIGSNSMVITLPIATNLYAGQLFEVNNNTTQSITLFNSGSTSLATSVSGSYAIAICLDNTTTNGIWDIHWLVPSNQTFGSNGLNVTGSLSASSLTNAPVFSNSNGALVNGSVSLTNQVVGVLPQGNVSPVPIQPGGNTTGSLSLTQQVSGVLPLANTSTIPIQPGGQTSGSISLTQQVSGVLPLANTSVIPMQVGGQTSGSVSLTQQVVGVLPLANTSTIPIQPGGQTSGSVSLTSQISGILPQGNLTLTPTFTQATLGSVTITSSAGGSAQTLRLPGAAPAPNTFLGNDGSGNAYWGLPPAASTINVTSALANYQVGSTDALILCSSASFTVTLPTAVGNNGRQFSIQHNGISLSQVYTLQTSGGQTISGIAGGSYALYTANEVVTVVSDNTNWQVQMHKTLTAETTYSPTFVSIGTASAVNCYWSRSGSKMKLRFGLVIGSVSASLMTMSLPSSATLGSVYIGQNALVGQWHRNTNGAESGAVLVTASASTTLNFSVASAAAIDPTAAANANGFLANGNLMLGEAEVSISGWQS